MHAAWEDTNSGGVIWGGGGCWSQCLFRFPQPKSTERNSKRLPGMNCLLQAFLMSSACETVNDFPVTTLKDWIKVITWLSIVGVPWRSGILSVPSRIGRPKETPESWPRHLASIASSSSVVGDTCLICACLFWCFYVPLSVKQHSLVCILPCWQIKKTGNSWEAMRRSCKPPSKSMHQPRDWAKYVGTETRNVSSAWTIAQGYCGPPVQIGRTCM